MQILDHLPAWAFPSAILNPLSNPDAPWAVALAAGDEEQALTRYVADFRRRPFLPDNCRAGIEIGIQNRWQEHAYMRQTIVFHGPAGRPPSTRPLNADDGT